QKPIRLARGASDHSTRVRALGPSVSYKIALLGAAAREHVPFHEMESGLSVLSTYGPLLPKTFPPSGPAAHRSDCVPYALVLCPVISAGLSLRRYDSPSMTRS